MSMLRMQVVETHPFWGCLLLHVRLVPSIGLGAIAATDCVRTIWYDPLLTEHLDLDELGFVLLHEVGHHVLESMDRSRGRDRHLWNCATDFAINRIIARIERPWPRGALMYRPPSGDHPVLGTLSCLLDPQYDGMIAEMIYERLVHDDLPPSTTTTLRIDGVEVPGVQDHGGGIDVHLPVHLDEEDREQLRARVGEALETWRSAEGRGDVAGGLDRAFDLDCRSTVPWRRLLARYSGQALGALDYSLSRPKARYLDEGVVVPGLVRQDTPYVVVVVDTSGSMSDEWMSLIGAELSTLRDLAPEMTVVVADAKVHQVVASGEIEAFLSTRSFKGGGGTDHRPVFEWVADSGRRPDLLVALTDLFTQLPKRQPHYPVVWITPEHHGEAPWGRVVCLE